MLPYNFDWQYYILSYQDLYDYGLRTYEQAKKHYLDYGCNENRKICDIRINNNGEQYQIDYTSCNNNYITFYSYKYLMGNGLGTGKLDDFKLSFYAKMIMFEISLTNEKLNNDNQLFDFIVVNFDANINFSDTMENHCSKLKNNGILFYIFDSDKLDDYLEKNQKSFNLIIKNIFDEYDFTISVIKIFHFNNKTIYIIEKKNEKKCKKKIGFVILRCVMELPHNQLWIECYKCIRKFYNEEIIIIDDNSNPLLIQNIQLVNTHVIKSEFPGARELLPYYYFYKLKPFDTAIFLHDSMFLNDEIDISQIDSVKFLWYFHDHSWDNIITETKYISLLENNTNLLEFYNSKQWYGCFGAMTVIDYQFVQHLETKYNFLKLVNHVKTRFDGMALERIIGLLSFFEKKVNFDDCSICGYITYHICSFMFEYNQYKNIISNKNTQSQIANYKIIKVWSGR